MTVAKTIKTSVEEKVGNKGSTSVVQLLALGAEVLFSRQGGMESRSCLERLALIEKAGKAREGTPCLPLTNGTKDEYLS